MPRHTSICASHAPVQESGGQYADGNNSQFDDRSQLAICVSNNNRARAFARAYTSARLLMWKWKIMGQVRVVWDGNWIVDLGKSGWLPFKRQGEGDLACIFFVFLSWHVGSSSRYVCSCACPGRFYIQTSFLSMLVGSCLGLKTLCLGLYHLLGVLMTASHCCHPMTLEMGGMGIIICVCLQAVAMTVLHIFPQKKWAHAVSSHLSLARIALNWIYVCVLMWWDRVKSNIHRCTKGATITRWRVYCAIEIC